MLSREAPRCDASQVIDVLRAAGCDVARTRRGLEVSVDGEPVMRLGAAVSEPWGPQDLALSIRDGIDATPLVLELTKVFGALEYTSPERMAVILDQPG